MAEEEQDRTEAATPFKLKEARRRGQVAKSLDVNTFMVLAAALAVFYFTGEKMAMGLLSICRDFFAGAGTMDLDEGSLLVWSEIILGESMEVFWPLVLALVIAAIVGNFMQTGPVFSFFPLKPELQKINPVQGAKRFFSVRLLFEAVKNIIKLVLFTAMVYVTIKTLLPRLVNTMELSREIYGLELLDQTRYLVSRMALVILVVALIDLQYGRWDYARRQRMSRREIKEEVKRQEGDPKIRARIRQLQREAVKRARSLSRVPDADIIITNPTRIAVALRYDRDTMAAPQVVAKGAGDLAVRIREIAASHRVPVVENRSVARKLFLKVEIDAAIPGELYPPVARLLVWALSVRQRRAGPLAGGR
jgi:flagellar biosynthetic protein FlhB